MTSPIDFAALSRDLTWTDVTRIPWDRVPVDGADTFKVHARDVAGKARSFAEFYDPENMATAVAVEGWLTRHSAEHTHKNMRG